MADGVSTVPSASVGVLGISDEKGKGSPAGKVDEEARNSLAIAGESDKEYREITKKIIDITEAELSNRAATKNPLRENLLKYIKRLLSIQFFVLVIMLACQIFSIGNKIDGTIFNVYIVSVFAETLAGLIVAVKFAFNSEEETKLIEVLNLIVEHFQKFG